MKLYSYPPGNESQNMNMQNMKLPPDFLQQQMQQNNSFSVQNPIQNKFQIQNQKSLMKPPNMQPLAPNSIKKYPQNVPYPYGMKILNNSDTREQEIKKLENLNRNQYRGKSHFRSSQYKSESN